MGLTKIPSVLNFDSKGNNHIKIGISHPNSRDFMSCSSARVILRHILRIAICGIQTDRGDSLLLDAKLANHYATQDLTP